MERRTFNTLAVSAGIAAISSPSLGSPGNGGKLRVCCVGFFHETNTYLTEGMGETTLDTMRVFRGDEIRTLRGTPIGGAVDVCEENGWDLLPGLIYGPDSSFGLVNAQFWSDAKEEMLDTLRAQMPLDIVYLVLHGAGVVDETPDLEGDLAESVRELVGEDTMIVWSGDLHGKVTDKMKDNMNFFSACKKYPHLDMNEAAQDAMYRAAAILAGESNPTAAFRKVRDMPKSW